MLVAKAELKLDPVEQTQRELEADTDIRSLVQLPRVFRSALSCMDRRSSRGQPRLFLSPGFNLLPTLRIECVILLGLRRVLPLREDFLLVLYGERVAVEASMINPGTESAGIAVVVRVMR